MAHELSEVDDMVSDAGAPVETRFEGDGGGTATLPCDEREGEFKAAAEVRSARGVDMSLGLQVSGG